MLPAINTAVSEEAAMSRGPMVITICSTKGGTGKTTLTANLGGLLADSGRRILLVDADIQPTLSSYFALVHKAGAGLRSLITEAAIDVVSRTSVGCDLIYSDDPDGELQNWIVRHPDGRVRLRSILRKFRKYDVILIDTQGAVGPLQDAAVLAADRLLSPIPPEILSAREFARGTVGMLARLRRKKLLSVSVGPLHGVINRMDRTVDAARIATELRKETYGPFRDTIRILETTIPSTVAYREAATAQMPVHRWETRRPGPSESARQTMARLAAELFPDLDTSTLNASDSEATHG